VSTGGFFGISVLLVLLWLPTIFVIPSVDTWQLVLNTIVSVLAFMLVALLQNSERLNDVATHRKLDAIAAGLADLMQHGVDPDAEVLKARVDDLRQAVGLEERV
jgi:low affinity Fe/Cu permease